MNERNTSSQLSKLDERLRTARHVRNVGEKNREKNPEGISFAFRVGVELVAALLVGVGIGLLLDRWLGTEPWFLIGLFVIGSGAGIVNVYRTAASLGLTMSSSEATDKDVETPELEGSTMNVENTAKTAPIRPNNT